MTQIICQVTTELYVYQPGTTSFPGHGFFLCSHWVSSHQYMLTLDSALLLAPVRVPLYVVERTLLTPFLRIGPRIGHLPKRLTLDAVSEQAGH